METKQQQADVLGRVVPFEDPRSTLERYAGHGAGEVLAAKMPKRPVALEKREEEPATVKSRISTIVYALLDRLILPRGVCWKDSVAISRAFFGEVENFWINNPEVDVKTLAAHKRMVADRLLAERFPVLMGDPRRAVKVREHFYRTFGIGP